MQGRVLILAPDPLLCETIVAVVEDAGLTCVSCGDAFAAEAMLEGDAIDAVVAVVGLDVEPMGNCLRAWIARGEERRRRVVVLHSTAHGARLAQSLNVRAVRMPFGVEELVTELRSALESA